MILHFIKILKNDLWKVLLRGCKDKLRSKRKYLLAKYSLTYVEYINNSKLSSKTANNPITSWEKHKEAFHHRSYTGYK